MTHIKYLILTVLIIVSSISCIGYRPDDEKTKYSDQQLLINYAAAGNLEAVKFHVGRGVDINFADKYDNTALIWASIRGHFDVVKYLVESGADIEAKNDGGNTALMHASGNAHAEIVTLLLDKNADINATNNSGNTALMTALGWNGDVEIVKLLIKENSIDIEAKNKYGDTALTIASNWHNKDIIKLLLDKGADINTKNNSGDTVLSRAAFQGDKIFVQYLLGRNALVDARALSFAIQGGGGGEYINIVKIFVEKKPTVVTETESSSGMTGLMWASFYGHLDIVEYLVENGSNVDAQDKDGKTALIFVSYYTLSDYMGVVKCLVEEGRANIAIRDDDGKTALVIARERGYDDIVEYLNGK